MREARTREEVAAAVELRRRVFRVRAPERGRIDGRIIHVVALGGGGRLVGTCRLLVTFGLARLAWFAVEPALRGRGAGTAILSGAERAARGAGAERMRLHARLPALSLYERAGYSRRGETFVVDGMEHLTMEKLLA